MGISGAINAGLVYDDFKRVKVSVTGETTVFVGEDDEQAAYMVKK